MTIEQTRQRMERIVEDFVEYEVPEDVATGAGPLHTGDAGHRVLKVRYFDGREVSNTIGVNGRRLSHCEWSLVTVVVRHAPSDIERPAFGLVPDDSMREMVDALGDVERSVIQEDSFR